MLHLLSNTGPSPLDAIVVVSRGSRVGCLPLRGVRVDLESCRHFTLASLVVGVLSRDELSHSASVRHLALCALRKSRRDAGRVET